jgi:hypothetical protein
MKRASEVAKRQSANQQAKGHAKPKDGTVVTEFAGHASALSSSESAKQPAIKASTNWNADTGASSHMTPHRHWFCSYSPHVIPI